MGWWRQPSVTDAWELYALPAPEGRLGNASRHAPRRDGVGARGARADLLSQSANCLLVSLRASCDARPLVLLHRNNIRESYNQGSYTGHKYNGALLALLGLRRDRRPLALLRTGRLLRGPLRLLEALDINLALGLVVDDGPRVRLAELDPGLRQI